MEILKAKPQGYCMGVAKALRKATLALDDLTIPRPIYSLGMIIHNKRVNNALQKRGLIVLFGDKEKALNSIDRGSVLFSAHGVKPALYELAYKKGLHIIDTTCKDVLLVHNSVKQALAANKKVFYLGSPGHAECEGVLGISKDITLLTGGIDIPEDSFIACQTTLSINDIKEASLKYNIPISNFTLRCPATTERQMALAEKVDLSIIVGDRLSNNTNKLLEVAARFNRALLIEDLSELSPKDLTNVNKVLITSGASTPPMLVDEVISYLKSDKTDKPVSLLIDSDLLP